MKAMNKEEIEELEALSQIRMASISQHARRDHLTYKATALIREHLAERGTQAGAWRAISEAPKSGMPVLLTGAGIHAVGWMSGDAPEVGTASGAYRKVVWTYFQPLPPPPDAEK